jgi:hypothetical protein
VIPSVFGDLHTRVGRSIPRRCRDVDGRLAKALVVGHGNSKQGAGAGMSHPFMAAVADGLADPKRQASALSGRMLTRELASFACLVKQRLHAN